MASVPFRVVLAHCLVTLSALFSVVSAGEVTEQIWRYVEPNGNVLYLPDNRKPALYTEDFGDCLGGSLIEFTRFDASFYNDNLTATFHFGGSTNLTSQAVMIYIGVYAYGESRFELVFDPCGTNMLSLCPVAAGVPISTSGIIPLGMQDIANVPSIAYSIPDFEGQAILRVFANETQSEVACYTAKVSNGATFSQPATVGSVLGIFTVVAIAASFATAIYGDSIPTMRKHYAHSLSVMVVFAVWHHIYYTGALSMNWPSVLVAFWSNFSWAAGMIYVDDMQDAIDRLVGNKRGKTSVLGAAGAGTDATNVGGGYDVNKIYRRGLNDKIYRHLAPSNIRSLRSRALEEMLVKRDSLANTTTGFKWYGNPVRAGLPLPGNYSGFAGTLSEEGIPASNAFMTGLIWFAILLLIVSGSIVLFKLSLDVLYRFKYVKTERLNYFRSHWRGYMALALLRTCYIAFFVMMFLTIFQFTYSAAPGPLALAAVVFALFFFGMFGIAWYAIRSYRARFGEWISDIDRVRLGKSRLGRLVPIKKVPVNSGTADNELSSSQEQHSEERRSQDKQSSNIEDDSLVIPLGAHDDKEYTKKFGWLASRFRRSRWWFFCAWLVYECVRAAFYAGASGHALVQVFALLAIEFIAFLLIMAVRPFEGQRLNIILVYLLGFSKVSTVALSAAFDVSFNLDRITTTVIGVVIIVIQALLSIVVLIAVAVSAFSSYMSVMRNREDFRPRKLTPIRTRYFAHLDETAPDVPLPKRAVASAEPTEPQFKEPYFSVNSVKRMAKIEDEDAEFQADIAYDPRMSDIYQDLPSRQGHHTGSNRISRAASLSSQTSFTNLPAAARLHRGSWTTREFSDHGPHPLRASESIESGIQHYRQSYPHPSEALSRRYDSRESLQRYAERARPSSMDGGASDLRTSTPDKVASETVSPNISREASVADLSSMAAAASAPPTLPALRSETPTKPSALLTSNLRASQSSPVPPGQSSPAGKRGSRRQRPRDSIDEAGETSGS